MTELGLDEFINLLTFVRTGWSSTLGWDAHATVPMATGDAGALGTLWVQAQAPVFDAWSGPSRFLGIILFSSLCGLIVGLIAAWTGSAHRRNRRRPDDSRLSKIKPPGVGPRGGGRWWNPRTWLGRRRPNGSDSLAGSDNSSSRLQVPANGTGGDQPASACVDGGHATTGSPAPPVLLSLPDLSPAPDDEQARRSQREVVRRFERIAQQLRLGVPTGEITREYGYTPAQVELIRESLALIERSWRLDEPVTSSLAARSERADSDSEARLNDSWPLPPNSPSSSSDRSRPVA